MAAEIKQPEASLEHELKATFRHSERFIPIRVVLGSAWEHEASQEQAVPIRSAPGPLVRAVLILGSDDASTSTIILTFAHQITDGRGALRAAEDLAAILNGAVLPERSLPPAQEDRVRAVVGLDSPPIEEPALDAPSRRLPGNAPRAPGRLRAFDASVPVVQVDELSADTTRALRERARLESCTVQAALCAAAALTLFDAAARSHVRINVPIDLRPAVNADDDVAICFGAAMVELERTPSAAFWTLARAAAEQLEQAKRPEALRAAALGLAAMMPTTPDDAEALMLAATTADIEITNLGVTTSTDANVEALWGASMTTQVEDEQILGVITHGGVLRMVNTTRNPIAGLLEGIHAEISTACRS